MAGAVHEDGGPGAGAADIAGAVDAELAVRPHIGKSVVSQHVDPGGSATDQRSVAAGGDEVAVAEEGEAIVGAIQSAGGEPAGGYGLSGAVDGQHGTLGDGDRVTGAAGGHGGVVPGDKTAARAGERCDDAVSGGDGGVDRVDGETGGIAQAAGGVGAVDFGGRVVAEVEVLGAGAGSGEHVSAVTGGVDAILTPQEQAGAAAAGRRDRLGDPGDRGG